jgi:hypothetical protein
MTWADRRIGRLRSTGWLMNVRADSPVANTYLAWRIARPLCGLPEFADARIQHEE